MAAKGAISIERGTKRGVNALVESMRGEVCESGSVRGSEPKVYDFNLVASRGFWRMVGW